MLLLLLLLFFLLLNHLILSMWHRHRDLLIWEGRCFDFKKITVKQKTKKEWLQTREEKNWLSNHSKRKWFSTIFSVIAKFCCNLMVMIGIVTEGEGGRERAREWDLYTTSKQWHNCRTGIQKIDFENTSNNGIYLHLLTMFLEQSECVEDKRLQASHAEERYTEPVN